MPRRAWLAIATVAGILIYAIPLASRLVLPAPTGAFDVGRQRVVWTDEARAERNTAAPGDRREVVAEIWYPAARGTGARAPYVSDLDRLQDAFVASGEVPPPAAVGLRFVQPHARSGATLPSGDARFPVVVLSPGNATNVSFYASLAEELASHGYVVVGLDHPFHVAAVALSDGTIAAYREGPAPDRVAERVADVRFVLDRLAGLDEAPGPFRARLDLGRVGIAGHSLGGITAAETCKVDGRLRACMNVDGQLAGGPLGVTIDARAPQQPFLYLTKETLIHPELERRFETAAGDTFRVVVPAARHDHFSDTAMFAPTAQPFDRTASAVAAVSRGFALAFFDHTLRGQPRSVLGRVDAPTDVYVNVYPLGGRPSLPAR